MMVQVLLFASYADAFGGESVAVPVGSGATVGDVVEALRRLPGGRVLPAQPLVAVDRVYAPADQPVTGSAEIALIPPVAGG